MVAQIAPQAVLGVDWHSLAAWRGLHKMLASAGASSHAPYIYLNYR